MAKDQSKNANSKIATISKEIGKMPLKPFLYLYDKITPDIESKISSRRQTIQSLKKKYQERRTATEKTADAITGFFGSIPFAISHVFWFLLWIVWNTGLIPGLTVFDPFPFGLLTMIVSLEAIFLAVFVLISQNRESKINDLREEIDLQINVQAENSIQRLVAKIDEIYGLLDPQGKSAVPKKRLLSAEQIERVLEEE